MEEDREVEGTMVLKSMHKGSRIEEMTDCNVLSNDSTGVIEIYDFGNNLKSRNLIDKVKESDVKKHCPVYDCSYRSKKNKCVCSFYDRFKIAIAMTLGYHN